MVRRVLDRFSTFDEWIIKKLPTMLILDTYQVMLAVSLICLGLVTVFGLITHEAGVMGRTLPLLGLRALWSLLFIAGGVLQLIGLKTFDRPLTRLGKGLCGLGCLAYALALFSLGTPPSIGLSFVFLFFAVSYALRIVVSRRAEKMPLPKER